MQISLLEIAKAFLTIGTTGFGGGLAIIALMQDYCVERKKWLSTEEFLHGIALGQFMGPFAVNATIFIGYRLRGFKGALTALLAFLVPSIALIILLSALYNQFHQLTMLQSALKGLGPVVIALILSAAIQMGKTKIKSTETIVLMIVSIILMTIFNLQIILILLLAFLYAFIKVRFFVPKTIKEGSEND